MSMLPKQEFVSKARNLVEKVRVVLAKDQKRDATLVFDDIRVVVKYDPPGSFPHYGTPDLDRYSVAIGGVYLWQAREIGRALRDPLPLLALGTDTLRVLRGGRCPKARLVTFLTMDMRSYSYPSFGCD